MVAKNRTPETITRPNGRLAAIRELLERDSLCRGIVSYLISHSEAADTARGIAEWWVNSAVSRTADALARLEAVGVVRAYPVHDSTSVYAYTQNRFLRQRLLHYFQETSGLAETPPR